MNAALPTAPPRELNADPPVPDFERRFGGVARLYGRANASRIACAHVAVVGLGGVGSWAAEALARSGIGAMTLVDLDHIAESNINRQVHALDGEIGRAKVQAMAHRISLINPACQLTVVDDFLDADNAQRILTPCQGIIDAVDDVRAKMAMALLARASKRPLAICGGAGAKHDLTCLRIDDLALVRNDALLARLRSRLRAEHGFPKGAPRGKPARFGLTCIYLDEAPPISRSAGGLNCAGYGSVVHVTAGLGLAASGWMIDQLIQAPTRHQEAGIGSGEQPGKDGSEKGSEDAAT